VGERDLLDLGQLQHRKLDLAVPVLVEEPGTDVMIIKIFSPKNLAKI
jgi:hypothetical protein